MKRKDKKKMADLDAIIARYLKSDKPMSEFRKENIFKEYSEFGDDRLKDIAIQYFIDHMT